MYKKSNPTLVLFLALTVGIINSSCQRELPSQPNVLFIAVDDLRPDLGSYGNTFIKTPHMDKLASESRLFENHFVQVPTCGASRYSLLTGQLPRQQAHLSNDAIKNFISGEPEKEKPETFIHRLRRSGYYTVGIGKISHFPDGLLYGYNEDPEGAERELPYSWDEVVFDPGKWGTAWNAFFGYADGSNRQSRNKKVNPYEKAAVNDEAYPDGLTANLAISKINELSEKEDPFFLGIGFFKPHLPFNAPKKYWDLYKESEIPLSPSPDIPENVHPASIYNSSEFNQYLEGEEKPSKTNLVSDDYARKIRHAYYASVSYVDAQVGKVLEELDRQGLSENTIVILWGDHGWQLGDHRVWGKHTIFEKALNSPLMIKVPGMNDSGIPTERVVSTIDIYPTLMDLCGLEPVKPTDGTSLSHLLKDPESKNWENISYSYFNNGISMRTKRYRLTRYFRNEEPKVELYDHKNDPDEKQNIAREQPHIIRRLMPVLNKGNTGLY